MKSKPKKCEYPNCNRYVLIRSRVKEGEFKGLKVCPTHKQKCEPKKSYKKFFESLDKKIFCENCGCKLLEYNYIYNLAHILPKRRYISVGEHPKNILYLCSSKDNPKGGCHERYDSSLTAKLEMKCFPLALQRFKEFQGEVKEEGNELKLLQNYVHKLPYDEET